MGCIGFLVYRFNAVFNVSKVRAAVVAILCFVGGVPFFVFGDVWVMIGLACWGYAFIYGCIWFFKFNRDQNIIKRAELEAQQYQSNSTIARQSGNSSAAWPRGDLLRGQATGNEVPGSQPVIELTNEITSLGSSRLFVPPPLDRPQ